MRIQKKQIQERREHRNKIPETKYGKMRECKKYEKEDT